MGSFKNSNKKYRFINLPRRNLSKSRHGVKYWLYFLHLRISSNKHVSRKLNLNDLIFYSVRVSQAVCFRSRRLTPIYALSFIYITCFLIYIHIYNIYICILCFSGICAKTFDLTKNGSKSKHVSIFWHSNLFAMSAVFGRWFRNAVLGKYQKDFVTEKWLFCVTFWFCIEIFWSVIDL